MNQSKKYGIKNPKWICFLKQLFAQTCQRTTMMWPQRLFVRLETSENIHEDEGKFEKFFSRTQKYVTCPASCEGEWEYGLPGKHTMAGCFEMIGRFWKSVCIFRRQIQISFFRIGPLFEEPRLFEPAACQLFGWFFNMYIAGSDSCLTQLSPSIWFGVVKIFLIIF